MSPCGWPAAIYPERPRAPVLVSFGVVRGSTDFHSAFCTLHSTPLQPVKRKAYFTGPPPFRIVNYPFPVSPLGRPETFSKLFLDICQPIAILLSIHHAVPNRNPA
jgi:hypothetical protein